MLVLSSRKPKKSSLVVGLHPLCKGYLLVCLGHLVKHIYFTTRPVPTVVKTDGGSIALYWM